MSTKTSVAVYPDDLDALHALKQNRKEPLYEVVHRLIVEHLSRQERVV